jgi:hypothetical protein
MILAHLIFDIKQRERERDWDDCKETKNMIKKTAGLKTESLSRFASMKERMKVTL